jgi:predicted metal-dependent hydrolase
MTDKETIDFGRSHIAFVVIRSSRRKKTMAISLQQTGEVIVRAPLNLSHSKIVTCLRSKAAWILEKQKQISSIDLDNKKEFVSGESFSYLGRHARLKVIKRHGCKSPEVKLRGGRLEVTLCNPRKGPYQEDISNALKKWYSLRAEKKISERVTIYARKMGLREPCILIRDQQTRWASCNSRGIIRFNWCIIMAPLSIVDYVVVHELCHLKYRDHSKQFWKLLGTIMPDYEDRKERLKKEGNAFRFNV